MLDLQLVQHLLQRVDMRKHFLKSPVKMMQASNKTHGFSLTFKEVAF